MIQDRDSAKIRTVFSSKCTNFLFAAEQRDLRQTLACAHTCRLNAARVFAFRKNDMLWAGGGALAYAIEYGHRVRSQKSEVRSQKSEVRSQKSEDNRDTLS